MRCVADYERRPINSHQERHCDFDGETVGRLIVRIGRTREADIER